MASPPARTDTCGKHGAFEARHRFGDHWSHCPACEREAKLGLAGVPPRFRDRTLASYVVEHRDQRRAKEALESYAMCFANNPGGGALLLGGVGTGKTHLACGIIAEVIASGHTAHYSTVQNAVRRVKATFDKGATETEGQAIAALTRPDLLVLDEIGVQSGTDFERNLMFEVINDRYANQRATVLISNLMREEVTGFLGTRVIDRMREDGAVVVVFDWESQRARMNT